MRTVPVERALWRAAVRGWLVLGLWASMVSSVAAHSFPTPFRILFDDQDAAHTVVLLRPGIALTETGGESWRFLCGAVTGIAGSEPYPAAFAGGHLLVGAYVGLYRDDGHGCAWSRAAGGLPQGRVLDVVQVDAWTVEVLLAATRDEPAGRYVSSDHGLTWTRHTASLPTSEPRTLARGPTATRALYLIGQEPPGAGLVVWASDDDGERWERRAELDEACDEILALHAERVVIRCRAEGGQSDRVILSDDGAVSFVPWVEVPELGGFALTPDGLGAWIGSRAGGLWRADSKGQLHLLQAGLHVGCLQLHAGTLWVCARDEPGYDPYALAVSQDGGHTLTPVLRAADVSALQTCGNPLQARVCNDEWNQWQADVALTQTALASESETSADASVTARPAPGPIAAQREQTCSAHTPTGTRAGWQWLVSAACLHLLRHRARRARTRETRRPRHPNRPA